MKFENAADWLAHKVNQLQEAGDAKALAEMIRSLTLDTDTIETVFQSDLQADGFYDEADEDYPVVTEDQRNAVFEAMGYEIDDSTIQEAVELFSDVANLNLVNELHDREIKFAAQGGRGAELAEEIDQLRIAWAARLGTAETCEA